MDVLDFLPVADRCGRRLYRVFGTRARYMDRDDWVQESRMALLRVFRKSYDPASDNPSRRLAYAVKCRVLTDVVGRLYSEKRTGVAVSLSDRDEREIGESSRDIALLEAAMDVQTVLADATPAEHAVLTATLADRFVGSSGASRWHADRTGERLTSAQKNHKHRFIARQRARLRAA